MTSNQTYLDLPSTFRSLYWPVAIVLGLLVAGLWLAGYGPGGSACRVAPMAALPGLPDAVKATGAAVAPVVAQVAAPVAAVPANASTVPPTQKLYFALNSTQVSAGAKGQLDKIVAYLKANDSAVAVLSGFHDPKGNQASNEELALNRARAVRTLLEELGIPRERVEMAKPASTTGATGDDQEARRVEVSVKG
jgi:outer membrane protein OmpA-like peptidoglycan-associated protein